MCPLLLLKSVDSSLGRLDYASLSQQTLMEMTIDGIENKELICEDYDKQADIEKWGGITLEENKVVFIDWQEYVLQGSVHLQWLPLSVRSFSVWENNLTGTIDLAHLPEPMRCLLLLMNAFFGSVDLQRLPRHIEIIDVSVNQLSGFLMLSSLPKSLKQLYAASNSFSGSINLTRLPAALNILYLSTNELNGSILLTELPKYLKQLSLDNNQFSGQLDMTQLPHEMTILDLQNNSFSGEIFIAAELFDIVQVVNTNLIKRVLT